MKTLMVIFIVVIFAAAVGAVIADNSAQSQTMAAAPTPTAPMPWHPTPPPTEKLTPTPAAYPDPESTMTPEAYPEIEDKAAGDTFTPDDAGLWAFLWDLFR